MISTIALTYTSLHIHPFNTVLSHILKTHFSIIHRRGVGMSVYSVRSLLVSLMLWSVQAACSPIRLLTRQGLDLERALPGGCLTTPSPASSAVACSARTDCVVCICEHSKPKKAGDVRTTSRCSSCAGQFPAFSSLLRRTTSFPRLVLRPFPSRFSHFAPMRRNILCELTFALSKRRLSSFIYYITRSHTVTEFLCTRHARLIPQKRGSLA
jgi:hypothetical protein